MSDCEWGLTLRFFATSEAITMRTSEGRTQDAKRCTDWIAWLNGGDGLSNSCYAACTWLLEVSVPRLCDDFRFF